MTEERTIGGPCVNRGCLPSKNLIEAAELWHEAAMALRFHATLRDFIDLVHVYPTMAEALKIAAISRFKDPSKLSCCAE